MSGANRIFQPCYGKVTSVIQKLKTLLLPSDSLKLQGLYALVGFFLFASIAHHLANIWERPATTILVIFVVGYPLVLLPFVILAERLRPHLIGIPMSRLLILLAVALILSGFVSWRLYRLPLAYQTILITPQVSLAKEVGLIEAKANGLVIPLEQATEMYGWQKRDGGYYATPDARPLQLTFQSVVNRPIILLFQTSPTGGAVNVRLNAQEAGTALVNSRDGQRRISLQTEYRGIPNWLFVSILTIADILTFGLLAGLILCLQELGSVGSQIQKESPHFQQRDLIILFVVGIILHTNNFLSVPIGLNADSRFYLQGALNFLASGNLDKVPPEVGPGTGLLLMPALWLFPENPQGIKLLLHLISLAYIPLCYKLGWQLSGNRLLAILSGLFVANSPDIYFYSNYVMSEIPNIFFILLFCNLLISANLQPSLKFILPLMLTASFATLIRSENTLLFSFAIISLIFSKWQTWRSKPTVAWKPFWVSLLLSVMIAVLPIFWWSHHNWKNHGYFGLSNYMGIVLYDGWVYFGDALGQNFSDAESSSIREIRRITSIFPPVITDQKGVATGWEIYPSLISAGYGRNEAITLMQTAATDSILNDPQVSFEILMTKYEQGLRLGLPYPITYPLPHEPGWGVPVRTEFFIEEPLQYPLFIQIQRIIYVFLDFWYSLLYPWGIIICVLALLFSAIRTPVNIWSILVLIVGTRIFLPLTLSVAFWRYSLAGWLPLQILALVFLSTVIAGAVKSFRTHKNLPTERC